LKAPVEGRIGFMQGRLSPLLDGRIQAFPREHWRQEFELGARLGFSFLEWTLDHEGLLENPLMTPAGRREISSLGDAHGLRVPSVTGDCFMQAPFYKASGAVRQDRLDEFRAVVEACTQAGVTQAGVDCLVFPLVDAGQLTNPREEDDLLRGLETVVPLLSRTRIAFESDYPPSELQRLLSRMPSDRFGINYDIGNSASLGFDPREEIARSGPKILNVHVKDRVRGGSTVPLGTGNADFPAVFDALNRVGYKGRFVLQTARAADGDHGGALCRYRDLVRGWLEAA
jgi:L-ribulose-5-phosphate 3-epimerase